MKTPENEAYQERLQRPPLRVLIIDDEITVDSDEFIALRELLNETTPPGRDYTFDLASTWKDPGPATTGLEYLLRHAYDLIVLDMVFPGQHTPGILIYDSIRKSLIDYPKSRASLKTPSDVPILLFTDYPPGALPMVDAIQAARHQNTLQIGKAVLRERKVDPAVVDRLRKMLATAESGLVLHVLIADGESRAAAVSSNLRIAFGYVGCREPFHPYIKKKWNAHLIIRDAVDPARPSGKSSWCFEVGKNQVTANAKTWLNKLFKEKTGHATAFIEKDPAVTDRPILRGVAEIHLHFENPVLFGLSDDTLILSRLPAGRLFVPEHFWDEPAAPGTRVAPSFRRA